jgi:hypothetical protein
MVNSSHNGQPLGRAFSAFMLIAMMSVAAPGASLLSADTQLTLASISGVVRDASGGVLPGVQLTLTDTTTRVQYWRVTDGGGSFVFPDLLPGPYTLLASLPGFATIVNELTLTPGQEMKRNVSMRIGVIEEKILVTCLSGGATLPVRTHVLAFDRRAQATPLFVAPSFDDAQALPVRVGGSVKAPSKIKDVRPVCPRAVPPTGPIVVTLEATVGTDGVVKDVRSLNPRRGAVPPAEFVDSAVGAVGQWRFTPTWLNNVPVPVIMSVTVEYRRM